MVLFGKLVSDDMTTSDTFAILCFRESLNIKVSLYQHLQIVIRVFEMDSYGKEVVRGYGAVHVPLEPGCHTARDPIQSKRIL